MKRQKYSEMVLDCAGFFIGSGRTPEERLNRLRSACTAWNYACVPERVRTGLLDKWLVEYRKWNPDVDAEESRALRQDMELLIEQKLKKYPEVTRQIVSCESTIVDGQDHIVVATVPQELPPNQVRSPQ
ncbi:MAG: hypothetical protein FJ387_14660 [Verrucomicrobia bacterium]|nr:hypothetical protein [Verrucomicrobiota bacterium]